MERCRNRGGYFVARIKEIAFVEQVRHAPLVRREFPHDWDLRRVDPLEFLLQRLDLPADLRRGRRVSLIPLQQFLLLAGRPFLRRHRQNRIQAGGRRE